MSLITEQQTTKGIELRNEAVDKQYLIFGESRNSKLNLGPVILVLPRMTGDTKPELGQRIEISFELDASDTCYIYATRITEIAGMKQATLEDVHIIS